MMMILRRMAIGRPSALGVLVSCLENINTSTSGLLSRSFSSLDGVVDSSDIKICIVGSGPAGFYVADRISKRLPGSRVDILERFPSPYGLVRSGVAPDHPDTKNVIHQFHSLMERGLVEYWGNVCVGEDVQLEELRNMYHAVVLAYGAGAGKRLSIPGKDMGNVVSARDFVNWYNGHPLGNRVDLKLEHVKDVVICGLGNVALDCARILLKDPVKDLHPTDISSRAVEALKHASIENVRIVSRRGPAQAACTPKELRELVGLPDVGVSILPADCLTHMTETCEKEMKHSRIHRRVLEVLRKTNRNGSRRHQVQFCFLSSPAEYCGLDGRVSSTRIQRMKLETIDGVQKAIGTDEEYSVDSQLVIESVGYRGEPIRGVPFDQNTGTIPNTLGKVFDDVYVCGWLKRGPSGIIGTNLVDAEQTVDTMVRHVSHWGSLDETKTGRQGLLALLQERNTPSISFKEWQKIDTEEITRGTAVGKVREKMTSVDDMLAVAMK